MAAVRILYLAIGLTATTNEQVEADLYILGWW
jgi:hypothetical protein